MTQYEKEMKIMLLKTKRWLWKQSKRIEKFMKSKEVVILKKKAKKVLKKGMARIGKFFDEVAESKKINQGKSLAKAAALTVVVAALPVSGKSPNPDCDKKDNFKSINMDGWNNLDRHFPMMLAVLLPTEGCAMEAYSCGVRQTIGVGSTVDLNGRRIAKRAKLDTYDEAAALVKNHISKYIVPSIEDFITRPLTPWQKAVVNSKIFNLGTGKFFGYNELGYEVGKPCNFVKNWNKGEPEEKCAINLMGFTSAGGKSAAGLINRSYLEGAVFLGLIKPHELLKFKLNGAYIMSSKKLCKKERAEDGSLQPDYSPEILEEFKKSCRSGKNQTVGEVMKKMGVDISRLSYPAQSVEFGKPSILMANNGR